MTKVAVYRNIGDNGPEMDYLAYIVLPNGKYWGVMFNGATEEIARAKAIALWESEKKKYKKLEPNLAAVFNKSTKDNLKDSPISKFINDPWAEQASMADKWDDIIDQDEKEVKSHHLSGLVWMIHKETREKKRVKLTEITMYEQWGYERGGPRSR